VNCEQAGEFVSALCDGQQVPQEAAEHIGTCESCRTLLQKYLEIGAELRRLGYLRPSEIEQAPKWSGAEQVIRRWWQRGRENMRIPKFAFVLLLVSIVALSSSLAIVKARQHEPGKVLMLTIKPENGQLSRCPLSIDDNRSPFCGSMYGTNSGTVLNLLRILGSEGDRFQIGVRAKFVAFPAQGGNQNLTYSFNEMKDLPETAYWFELGKPLEIRVPEFGSFLVTGELLDHMPSIIGTGNELDPAEGELRVVSPALLRGKEKIFDLEGASTIAHQKEAVFLYAPGQGRFLLSLAPLQGGVEGRVQQSRVHFEENAKQYEFLMGAPVSRAEWIWVLHQPEYRPSLESPENRDDQTFLGSANVEDLIPKSPQRNN